MKRRSALKNMSMALGYAVATPTLLGVLQSCKDKPAYAEWMPTFLGKDEGYALAQTVDIILPKTETPSATELNVHVFIDTILNELLPDEDQQFFSFRMGKFFGKVMEGSGKEELSDLEAADIEPVLATYLKKRSDDVEKTQAKAIELYREALESGESADLDEETACYSFANELRGTATWAYKNTEFIGEQVLAYDPVPGAYIPCGDAKELTDGKAWSL